MKVKRQKHSIIFRGLVLVVAFALAVLCAPIDGFIALAQMNQYSNYSYMTIGRMSEPVQTTVTKGEKYTIPNAYIGNNEGLVVGKVNNQIVDDVTIKSSKVTVNYSTMALDEFEGVYEENVSDITNQVVVTPEAGNYGFFRADKVGNYTITYSYEYVADGETYSNSYSLQVKSELSSVSISFKENEKHFIPSIIDLAQAKEGDSYKDLYLPKVEITDEDGDVVENVTYVRNKDEIQEEGNFVVVSVKGGDGNATAGGVTVELNDETGEFYVSGNTFKDPNYGAGKYTVRYAYYSNNQFITAVTKSTQVYSEENKYYEKYSLTGDLASDWANNGQTGVESTLPKAVGLTTKNSKPENESVDVYYTVEVLYKSTGTSSNSSYEQISATEYNKDLDGNGEIDEEEKVVNADGTLVNPTEFKPLKDGWYTFIYTVYDFYGNHFSTSKGVYEFSNVKDEQKPTPVVFDASNKDEETRHEDASSKLASRSVPNSVVIYAIGIDDNVSKAGEKDVELTRKIMTDETVSKLTISDYDEFNLIFNYRATANKAFDNLLLNNYLVRNNLRDTDADLFAKVQNDTATDVEMLAWLKNNNYRIVVDNANYTHIYEIFDKDGYFTDDMAELDVKEDANKTKILNWFKGEAALTAGFAYIDVDETFGATASENGMGSGQYYIHYIAKDAAGNEQDISKSMYIGSYEDNDAPEIKFPTTLADTYLPTATITFDTPTASDNYDTNMVVRTMYRYLNGYTVIPVVNKDNETLSDKSLSDLWKDLEGRKNENNKLYTEVYKDYHEGNEDGYVELTDTDATSYTIDLNEVKDATNLQIFVFTYDDKGNISVYAETISISNTKDVAPPQHIMPETTEYEADYVQGADIELPTISVNDDAVGFMSFEVNVYYVNGDLREKVTAVRDYYAETEIKSLSGMGTYTVHGGRFTAANAGRYEVSIAVKDSKGNTVVSFANYNVSKRTIIQKPDIVASLESKTIELDGDSNYDPEKGIEIPVPTVTYEIPGSVTFDEYKKSTAPDTDFADVDYVVMGVDANGKANGASATFGAVGGAFKPTEVRDYPIYYTVNLTVYNRHMFEFVEMNMDAEGNYDEGGYFEFKNGSLTAKVYINNDGSYTVKDSNNDIYTVYRDENKNAVVTLNGSTVTEFAGTIFEEVTLENWFENELVKYTLTSDIYTITVQDTKGPVIAEYDYVDSLTTAEIEAETDGYKLKIYGIEAEDKSGINIEKSKIVLSWKLANGDTGSKTYDKADKDQEYTIKASTGNVLDGTYTITYTVYDNNNNSSSKEYTIAVGDNVPPTMKFEDDFVEDSYEIGDKLKIDISKITTDDNRPMEAKYEITLKNTTTEKEIEYEEVGGIYTFVMDEIGTYTLTVEVEDTVGNKTTETFNIEVSKKGSDTTMTYQVIGTILIVISVLVLVGVIVYFIVSKVKLDKELKK